MPSANPVCTPAVERLMPLQIAAFCILWSSAFAVAKLALLDCPPLFRRERLVGLLDLDTLFVELGARLVDGFGRQRVGVVNHTLLVDPLVQCGARRTRAREHSQRRDERGQRHRRGEARFMTCTIRRHRWNSSFVHAPPNPRFDPAVDT